MKPRFLVYTDHPMCSLDCSDAVCEVLNQSGLYKAKMIGPSSYPELEFNEENIKKANCLVFPGGWGNSDQFDDKLIKHKSVVENYIKNGGRYLGVCMGAYFAGKHYFDILTGADAVQYIKRKKSTVKRSTHDIVELTWNNIDGYNTYFHDGAAFVPTHGTIPAKIIGKYKNGDAAAIIQPYKKGMVGVIGPHPEAMKWWFYSQPRITNEWKTSIQHDLFLDFVGKLMA